MLWSSSLFHSSVPPVTASHSPVPPTPWWTPSNTSPCWLRGECPRTCGTGALGLGQVCWVTVYLHILALSEYCQMLSRITTWICRLAGVNDIYILDHSLLLVLTLQVSSFKRSFVTFVHSILCFKKKKNHLFLLQNVLQRWVLNSPKWSYNYEQVWVAFHPNINFAMFSDVAMDSITQMWTLACLNEVLGWGLMQRSPKVLTIKLPKC